jgi:hypothetical protein
MQVYYLSDLLQFSLLLIFRATFVWITFLGINLRGSPGLLGDHPSCGDLPITKVRPTVLRELGGGISDASVAFKHSIRSAEKTPDGVISIPDAVCLKYL